MWEARRAHQTINSGKLITFILEGVVGGVMWPQNINKMSKKSIINVTKVAGGTDFNSY